MKEALHVQIAELKRELAKPPPKPLIAKEELSKLKKELTEVKEEAGLAKIDLKTKDDQIVALTAQLKGAAGAAEEARAVLALENEGLKKDVLRCFGGRVYWRSQAKLVGCRRRAPFSCRRCHDTSFVNGRYEKVEAALEAERAARVKAAEEHASALAAKDGQAERIRAQAQMEWEALDEEKQREAVEYSWRVFA